MKFKPVIAVAAFAVLASGVAGALHSETPRMEPVPGLHIGLSEERAVAAMRQIDPSAFTGNVCLGHYGVMAWVKKMGMSWQLMARVDNKTVSEMRYHRSSRKNVATQSTCRDHFESVADFYSKQYDSVSWERGSVSKPGSGLDLSSTAHFKDGTSAQVSVVRYNKARSLCYTDIVFAERDQVLPVF